MNHLKLRTEILCNATLPLISLFDNTMERYRALVPKISRPQRVNQYLENTYDHDHLHLGISSLHYHRHKHAQLLKALDVFVTLFDTNNPSESATAFAHNLMRLLPELGR